jgi:regulator of nucleoside diphosphate kinase
MMPEKAILVTRSEQSQLERTFEMFGVGTMDQAQPWALILRDELDHATLIGDSDIPEDVVTMNSTFLLRDCATGQERLLTLVYPSFSTFAEGKVPVTTPLGAALLGSRAGDRIECGAPAYAAYEVVDILYQPEASISIH